MGNYEQKQPDNGALIMASHKNSNKILGWNSTMLMVDLVFNTVIDAIEFWNLREKKREKKIVQNRAKGYN